MTRQDGGETPVDEFLGFWIERGGFDYVDGGLEPMKKHFGDHCFPSGAEFDDSGVVVIKVQGDCGEHEQDKIALTHLETGASVVVTLISPATIVCVHRSDEFRRRFPAG